MTDDADDEPPYVGQRNDHTGVGDALGYPYTYEHVEEPPEPAGDVYRITAYIDFTEKAIHKNVYYVPAERLDTFVRQRTDAVGEQIVDIRPINSEEAEETLAWYRGEE